MRSTFTKEAVISCKTVRPEFGYTLKYKLSLERGPYVRLAGVISSSPLAVKIFLVISLHTISFLFGPEI